MKMNLLDDYFETQLLVHNYFGYVEDWVSIPLDDARQYYWHLPDGEGYGGRVVYAKEKHDLDEEGQGDYYEDEIYTQRFLPKWVYRAKDYTMICCNPGVDGNKFLRIFDNTKELK